MQAVAELRSAPAYLRQLTNEVDDRLGVAIVEIVPADRPIQHHPP